MADVPQPPKQRLFAAKKPAQNQEIVSYLSSQVNSLSGRLRLLEERFSNIRNKLQVSETGMLSFHKKTNMEFKTLTSEIVETRKEMNDLKSELQLVIKELKLSAKREDVRTLEKYIEMWQPLHFVTKDQVEKIVRRILEEEGKRFINV